MTIYIENEDEVDGVFLEDEMINIIKARLPHNMDGQIDFDAMVSDLLGLISDKLKITSLDLNTQSGIKIVSDNTPKNTHITVVDTGTKLICSGVSWYMGHGVDEEIGRLILECR